MVAKKKKTTKQDNLDFDDFDEDEVVEEKKNKKEEEVVKATDGEVQKIGNDGEDDDDKNEDMPVIHEIDDIIEPSEFAETRKLSEFLEEHAENEVVHCILLGAKIVTGKAEYKPSAFIRVTLDYKNDKLGEWIRTSSDAFKNQVDTIIEKKAFPTMVRLAAKRNAIGKIYFVLNG